MDIRIDRVLPFRTAKDGEDEKHVHPLQLDVIERAVVMWSNPGENVLTPFMGVGSEVYGAALNKRRAIGFELKPSYFAQAVQFRKFCRQRQLTWIRTSPSITDTVMPAAINSNP